MKILGLIVTFVGILTLAGSFILTPSHAFNAADSISGLDASAALAYGGVVVFGLGVI